MSPAKLRRRISLLLDALVWAALAGTQDVSEEALLGALAVSFGLFALRRALRRPRVLPDFAVFLGMAATVTATGITYFRSHHPPLVIAAHAVLPILLLLQSSGDARRTQLTRLAVHFIALLVCAALTPDFYLAGVLLAFVLLGALALSAAFLEGEYERHAPRFAERRLPRVFYTHVFGTSVAVLVLSLALFPLLPRTQRGLGSSWGRSASLTQVGYTEEVDLSSGTRWAGAAVGRTALRILAGEEMTQNLGLFFPGKLLRAKSLDYFDGDRWVAGQLKPLDPARVAAKPAHRRESPVIGRISVLLSPLASLSLVVPYRAADVRLSDDPEGLNAASRWAPFRSRSGDWILRGFRTKDLSYIVTIGGPALPAEPPTPAHLRFPASWRGPQWDALSREVFGEAPDAESKIARLRAWMNPDRFRAGFENVPPDGTRAVIERFLTSTRTGHCELFASSAALLLRYAGVPTRLVSGFRIRKEPVQGVLLVRDEDAHAWVEAWDARLASWVPLDPTPVFLAVPGTGLFARVTQLKDGLEALWYRWIIGFDERREEATWRDRFRAAFLDEGEGYPVALGLSAALLLGSLSLLFRGRDPWQGSFSLRLRRRRVESWEKKTPERRTRSASWWSAYKALRFGGIGSLRALDAEWSRIKRDASP